MLTTASTATQQGSAVLAVDANVLIGCEGPVQRGTEMSWLPGLSVLLGALVIAFALPWLGGLLVLIGLGILFWKS
jgi:hypothetical protein